MTDIVVFDLETTGLDVDNDRIVQFAAIRLASAGPAFEEVERLKLLINPGIPIPAVVTEIHHITDDDVADEPRFDFYASGILDFIGDADIGGHNVIAYDLPLLIAELQRCGKGLQLEGRRLHDTKQVFFADVPHTLKGALKHYCGRDIGEDAHDALVDAKATVDVLLAQLEHHDIEEHSETSIGNRVTLDGNIVRDADGEHCIGFGKHAGTPLAKMPHGYLRWMLKQDFSDETKAMIERYV